MFDPMKLEFVDKQEGPDMIKLAYLYDGHPFGYTQCQGRRSISMEDDAFDLETRLEMLKYFNFDVNGALLIHHYSMGQGLQGVAYSQTMQNDPYDQLSDD